MISDAFSLASWRLELALACASSRSRVARSAAFRPSAIFCLRSFSAPMIGGHTNFMQNQTNKANQTTWPSSVALMFMRTPQTALRGFPGRVLLEDHQERDSDTHDRHGVEQTGDNEHTRLQHRSQFRLTSNALEETAAHQAEAHTGADGRKTSNDCSCKQVEFHFPLPFYV